jgi:hypothetical protein
MNMIFTRWPCSRTYLYPSWNLGEKKLDMSKPNNNYLNYFCVQFDLSAFSYLYRRSSWPWSYGSWIYNYLCNQCLSPLMLWVRILIRARCTTLCDKVCQWLATDWCFFPGPLFSSTNKTNSHDITEILLKVALNTIKQTSLPLPIYIVTHR